MSRKLLRYFLFVSFKYSERSNYDFILLSNYEHLHARLQVGVHDVDDRFVDFFRRSFSPDKIEVIVVFQFCFPLHNLKI